MGSVQPIDKAQNICDHWCAVRMHIVVPDDVIEEVDRLVGRRRRSAFFAEAARERLRRERLRETMKEAAGILKAKDYPEWETPQKVAAWVRKLRQQSNRRLEKLYGRIPPR